MITKIRTKTIKATAKRKNEIFLFEMKKKFVLYQIQVDLQQ